MNTWNALLRLLSTSKSLVGFTSDSRSVFAVHGVETAGQGDTLQAWARTALSHRRCFSQRATLNPLLVIALILMLLVTPRAHGEADLTITDARSPVVVPVTLPSPEVLLSQENGALNAHADALADRLLRAQADYPGRLLVLDVHGGLRASAQLGSVEKGGASEDEVKRYETAIARLLLATFKSAASAGGPVPVSVMGLPMESTGPDSRTAGEANERYGSVIDSLSAFVTRKSFILMGQGSSELNTARGSLSEAFRLHDGRPMVFRTNGNWRIAYMDDAVADDRRLVINDQLSSGPAPTLASRVHFGGLAPIAAIHRAETAIDDHDNEDDESTQDSQDGSAQASQRAGYGGSTTSAGGTRPSGGSGAGRSGGARSGRSGGGRSLVSDSAGGSTQPDVGKNLDRNPSSSNAPSQGESKKPRGVYPSESDEDTRTMSVATWFALDIQSPDWIKAAILRTQGQRRMFGWYNGDYESYTADVLAEIEDTHNPGEPVCLMLQHWMQKAHTGGEPSAIDPFGMFTHADDRTDAGLPGIWPEKSIEYWTAANEHLFSELKSAGVNVTMLALDTEVTPRGGPYGFEGTHEAIVADPRWSTEPLRGFDGLTAADLIPPGVVPGTTAFDEWIRLVGQHSFAHAYNEVLDATALVHFPEMLISDFTWHDIRQKPTTDETRPRLVIRAEMIANIMQVVGVEEQEYWLQKGVGNTASPSWKGQRGLDGTMQHADELIEMYGADRVVPWITDRVRMNHVLDETVTINVYEQFIANLVERGIERFLWHPGGSKVSPAEQQIVVDAMKDAIR